MSGNALTPASPGWVPVRSSVSQAPSLQVVNRGPALPNGMTRRDRSWQVAGPARVWLERLDRAIVEIGERWAAPDLGAVTWTDADVEHPGLPILRVFGGGSLHSPRLATALRAPAGATAIEADHMPLLVRDVVIAGTTAESRLFLHLAWNVVDELRDWLELPLTWSRHDQRRDAVVGPFVLCTTHRHGDALTTELGISRGTERAESACLSVRADHWLFAMTRRWGADATGWPDPLSAARVLGALRDG